MFTRFITSCSALFVVLASMLQATPASAEAYLKCDGAAGTKTGPGGTSGWFVADSFSFGVEREMKESGEKGGTEDINIGVGELQECTISKSLDAASATLSQFAINGNSLGECNICLTSGVDAKGAPICYLRYKLGRAFVKNWSASGGGAAALPTEEVALYYNRIAFAYLVGDARDAKAQRSMSWDLVMQRPWPDGLNGIFDGLGSSLQNDEAQR